MSEKEDLKDQELKEQEADQTEDTHQDAEAAHEQEPSKGENPQEEADAEKLDEIKKELDEIKNQNLRLYADFENFRKRTAKERVELYSTANIELMEALLPVLDDFSRAMKAQEDDSAAEGFKLIYNKLLNVLKNKGLKPMEESIGKKFDVDTMEAITRIPAPEKKLKGKVIDEVEPGYFLGNKILRYAKVVVGE